MTELTKDVVVIGTAANVSAEYGADTGDRTHRFVVAHFYDGEPVSVEGFTTKEAALKALEEYHGADIERLFTELDERDFGGYSRSK
jgi:hypothetical protein